MSAQDRFAARTEAAMQQYEREVAADQAAVYRRRRNLAAPTITPLGQQAAIEGAITALGWERAEWDEAADPDA